MKKKVNILLVLAFLMVLILCTSYAYSKYKTDVKGNARVDVAKWNISVNNCNIVDQNSESNNCFESLIDEETGEVTIKRNFSIGELFYNNNGSSTIVDNKIGPGSKGYFFIRIKPNDTAVSIKYNLKASVEQENYSIKLYRSNPNDSNFNNRVPLEEEGFEGIIKYSSTNKNREEVIIIYVDWDNIDSEENDILDTQIGTSGSAPTLNIPVSIEFEQYKG